MNEIKPSQRVNIQKEKSELIELFGGCVVCGFDYKPVLEIHHIIPISLGGSNDINNLFPLCPNCHSIVHNVAGDSVDKYGSDYADEWLSRNKSKVQKKKIFDFALEILQGRYPDERIIDRS